MSVVQDIMTTRVHTLSPDMEIAEAAKLLLEKRINGAPVVDENGALIGILVQSDLIAVQKKFPTPSLFTILDGVIQWGSSKSVEKEVAKIAAATVAQAMTPDPITVSPQSSIQDVATLMVDKKLHTLPVVEEGRLVGIVGKEDVLRTLMK